MQIINGQEVYDDVKIIKKSQYRAGYMSGGFFDFVGWGKTQAEAVKNLKKSFIAKVAERTHERQNEAEAQNKGYSFAHRLDQEMRWQLEYIKNNCHIHCERFDTEGTENDYVNSTEVGCGAVRWSPKYEIKLGY